MQLGRAPESICDVNTCVRFILVRGMTCGSYMQCVHQESILEQGQSRRKVDNVLSEHFNNTA